MRLGAWLLAGGALLAGASPAAAERPGPPLLYEKSPRAWVRQAAMAPLAWLAARRGDAERYEGVPAFGVTSR